MLGLFHRLKYICTTVTSSAMYQFSSGDCRSTDENQEPNEKL